MPIALASGMPIRLPPRRMAHFYRGGSALADFRRENHDVAELGGYAPEEWLGSVVARFGKHPEGITLVDGARLDQLIEADPAHWLGTVDPAAGAPVLTKLLDAGEWLPVHVHPDAAFARDVLDAPSGKAEAWLILATPSEAGEVLLGFSEDVSAETLERWVREQNGASLVAAMNRIRVRPGDTVFVPPGVPHAIGPGVLLIEVQEPADLSILLEWERFPSLDADAALLGLPLEVALSSVRCTAIHAAELESWVRRATVTGTATGGGRETASPSTENLLPPDAAPYFRLERLRGGQSPASEGFRVVVVTHGRGRLTWADGAVDTGAGDAWLVAAAVGPLALSGEDVVAVAASGPRRES